MKFYIEAFCTFFKIGLFTIGGGYAMVPLIEEEVVNKKKWLIQEDFIDLCRAIPKVDAGLAASIFHFGEVSIADLKNDLKKQGFPVRL